MLIALQSEVATLGVGFWTRKLSPARVFRVLGVHLFRFLLPHHHYHHIISYHIISYHIISYHIISYHIISYHIISYHIISYHIMSNHTTSYHTIPYHIMLNTSPIQEGLPNNENLLSQIQKNSEYIFKRGQYIL